MSAVRKIINDPVYGFITINDPLIWELVSHPVYQRLRNIHQMAFAHLVYPGAVHTRLHHSLGAYHLMCFALQELQDKGIAITPDEAQGAKAAILLHDIGHGPFSHALEHELVPGLHHETLSILIMERLNRELGGRLQMAIDIFKGDYPKQFLHQLISGQLDVDRMDYLNRDSFFTGVAEGVIGYDRIIKMLTVKDNELLVEEKAIYSIEKFLVSRRLMYWQVYLHKTVVGAEQMLVRVIRRARELKQKGIAVTTASPDLDYFLGLDTLTAVTDKDLDAFCRLDDHDVMATLKGWVRHEDLILSTLCRALLERKLFKVKLQAEPVSAAEVSDKIKEVSDRTGLSATDCRYFVFTGEAVNTTYNPKDEHIRILFKDGTVRDISQVDNALIHQHLNREVKKYYLCHIR